MSSTSMVEPNAINIQSGARFGITVRRFLGVGLALVVLFVVLSITQENFLRYSNLMNILRTNSVLFVAGVGLTFVIVGQGLDLSIGSLVALGGVFLASMLAKGVPVEFAIIFTILGCAVLGAIINGGLIAYGGFNFFVVTLAMLQLFRGAALVLSSGKAMSTANFDLVQFLGDGRVGAVPVPVAIAVLVGVVGYVVMRWTRFGRAVYAVGGNEVAARLAGVDVRRIRFSVYAISALCAGIAAVMFTGRLTTSQPMSGAMGLELSAAAAVLLGGASFSGGSGTIAGTAIGVVFLGVLANGITLAGVPSYWQGIATGAVLIFAIALDRLRSR
jgi:ribose transport system permease protein